MADEPLIQQVPLRAARYVRTHTGSLTATVNLIDQDGAVISREHATVRANDPDLTPTQQARVIDAIKDIFRFAGRIA